MVLSRKKIELAMAEKQMSRREVAEKMGVTTNCINVILRRQTTAPKTVGRLAAALGVPVVELIEDE